MAQINKEQNVEVTHPTGSKEAPSHVTLKGGKATKGKVLTVGQNVDPTNGIVSSVDINAEILFSDDVVSVPVRLLGGVVYPYSIKRVVTGTGIVGLY